MIGQIDRPGQTPTMVVPALTRARPGVSLAGRRMATRFESLGSSRHGKRFQVNGHSADLMPLNDLYAVGARIRASVRMETVVGVC